MKTKHKFVLGGSVLSIAVGSIGLITPHLIFLLIGAVMLLVSLTPILFSGEGSIIDIILTVLGNWF